MLPYFLEPKEMKSYSFHIHIDDLSEVLLNCYGERIDMLNSQNSCILWNLDFFIILLCFVLSFLFLFCHTKIFNCTMTPLRWHSSEEAASALHLSKRFNSFSSLPLIDWSLAGLCFHFWAGYLALFGSVIACFSTKCINFELALLCGLIISAKHTLH